MNYVKQILSSVFLLVTVFSLSFPGLSFCADQNPDIELIYGPELVMIESKGAMLRLFTLNNLMKDRAHQLKLSFFPKIEDGALTVKFYRPEGTPLGQPIPLKEGRAALLDLDQGIDGIMVMVEENGQLEKKIRLFASMYRYKEGKGPELSSSSLNNTPSGQKPEFLVTEVDLLKESGLSSGDLDTLLKKLSLSKEEATSLVLAFKNVTKYVAAGNFGGANYFLKEAEKVYPCGEVYIQRSFIFGPVDVDMAIKNADKAIELIKEGKTVSVLLGKGEISPEARACVIGGNAVLQKTFGKGRIPAKEEKEMKAKFTSYMARALELDSGASKKAVDILKAQWEKAESTKPEPDSLLKGNLDKDVEYFFKARELFVEKRYSEALDFIENHPNLPRADSVYLKAEILLNLGRKEGARKALERSVHLFDGGNCLAGKNGGSVKGTVGAVPPSSVRAALARVSLARYWAEKFAQSNTSGDRKLNATYIQTAIDYMDQAIEAVPSHREWQLLANTYRTAKLKYLYP